MTFPRRHVWQEVNELGYMVRCVSCGAHFSMTEEEYKDSDLPVDEAARRHGVGGTCDEEEVRRVMES